METPKFEQKSVYMINILKNQDEYVIPQFQRTLVWSKKRQETFLKNVLEGEPFGTILIHKNDAGQYEIVDGLQRISTLKKFYNDPLEYLNPDDIKMDKINELISKDLSLKDSSEDEEDIKGLNEEIRERIFDCIKENYENFDVMRILKDEYQLSNHRDIDKIINKIYSDFKKYIDIETLQIPAIIYNGPEGNVPNVFCNLNTGGVQLTKYDIFAATWSKTKFKVDDNELIEIVVDKYTQLEKDSETDVDFSEESLKDEGITLFEYCYALGGIMRNKNEKFHILFNQKAKSTEWIGFDLLALLLNDQPNKTNELYPKLKKVSPDFLVKLKDTLKENLEEIAEALSPLLNGMNNSSLQANGTYMINHMIISYLKEYYEINPKTKTIEPRESDLSKESFKKYAKIHYFHDCITDLWNNKRQESDLYKAIEDDVNRQKYWHNITDDDWKEAIGTFMDSQQDISKRIPQKNKLFIDFLTKLKKEEKPQYETYFSEETLKAEKCVLDYEHIVPRKVIDRHITASQQKNYPMSAIGNLCYLSGKDNKAKRDKTLYQDVSERTSYALDQNFLDYILYPSEDKLNFLEYPPQQFQEAYETFLIERQNNLREEFLRLIKNF